MKSRRFFTGVLLLSLLVMVGCAAGQASDSTVAAAAQATATPTRTVLPATATPAADRGDDDDDMDEPPMDQTWAEPRTLTVLGVGRVRVQPDIAVISLGVQTSAVDPGTAISQTNASMESLIATLEDAGIASEDIQTQYIQLWPQYDPNPSEIGGLSEPAGYQATNVVEVRVRDLNELSELLNQAVEAGSNTIQGIRFEVSDTPELLDEARQAAWDNAVSKAAQWADLSGVELGAVYSVSESSSTPGAFDIGVGLGGGGGVPIETGSQEIQVSLTVRWLLR